VTSMAEDHASEKSRSVALALAAILGPFGAHRFYVGKTGTGILMLCTLGGAGLWYLYDVILVAGGSFRDAGGKLVSNWSPEQPEVSGDGVIEHMAEEIEALRAELAELAERVEFTERLLAGAQSDPAEPQLRSGRWGDV
jgi:TM2 domain-containing membrane protein YozV